MRVTVPTLLILFVVIFFAVGWYFSSKFINVNLQNVDYDQTVQAILNDEYSMSGSAYDVDGIIGGIRSDGSMIGVYSAPSRSDTASKTSTRKLQGLSGIQPKVGDKISLQGNIWTTNPKTALGIDHQRYLQSSG